MEKNFHFVKQRLDNIKTIKPLLMSLRTISLSNWKLALRKLEYLKAYSQSMDAVLGNVLLKDKQTPQQNQGDNILFALGSSRGLCGGYNRDLLDTYLAFREENPGLVTQNFLFGEKIAKLFIKNNLTYQQMFSYPKIGTLKFSFINTLLAQTSPSAVSPTVYLLYNTYMGSGKYEPVINKVIPDGLDIKASHHLPDNDIILDSPIEDMSNYIQRLEYLTSIYEAFLSSFAAEHSTRFQIMESSISNTDKLIQELTITVQVERQKKVTSEMRELSVSAGLLDKE